MRDPLDRYYTPEALAHNLTSLLPLKFKKVIESSVGGGAFARAVLLQSPKELIGVDIDPNAPGKLNCYTFIEGDWLEVSKNISCDLWVILHSMMRKPTLELSWVVLKSVSQCC